MSGCAPAEDDAASHIERTRVIAVRFEPAEARPGAQVQVDALVVGPDGPRTSAQGAAWALCLAPKPPTENNSVDVACLGEDAVEPLGSGLDVMATLPAQGCQLFGPLSPGPELRPRDADITGGYYQPVRLTVDAEVAFGLGRLRCDLAQAPLSIAQAYEATYQDNVNPVLEAWDAPSQAQPGQRVVLAARTDAPEPYVRFDAITRALVHDEEVLTVSWFATGGELSQARTTPARQRAEVVWVAPSQPGRYWLFAVLRDSRGGVDWETHALDVE